MLLLDVDPQSLHFEDDAVVFSSHLPQSRRVATPECLHSYLLPLLWPGFYTTPRDSNAKCALHLAVAGWYGWQRDELYYDDPP